MTDFALKFLARERSARVEGVRMISTSIYELEAELDQIRLRRKRMIEEADQLVEAIIQLGGQPAEPVKEQVG